MRDQRCFKILFSDKINMQKLYTIRVSNTMSFEKTYKSEENSPHQDNEHFL
jgi:hypothetical protein